MKNNLKTIISYALVALIILSLPMVNSTYKKAEITKKSDQKSFVLSDIQKLYPQAASYRQNSDKSYNVLSQNEEEIARFIVSSDYLEPNFGYTGEINVLIGFRNGKTDGTVLLENIESRDYVKKVVESGLFQKCDQYELSEIPKLNLDAVSGATFTSQAVIKAIKESVGVYMSVATNSKGVSGYEILKITLFILIIILSFVSSFKKGMSKYRTAYLIILIILSGFMLQTMLSVTTFDGWIKQGISLKNSWQTLSLLILALVMPMCGKNRYYCTFLCPMGALQELTGKLSPIKKRSLKFLKFKYFNANDIYLTLIIVAMFSSLNVDLTYLEPFAAFAITIAPVLMLLFGGIVILLSLFFNRPWCAICPTGCILNHLGSFTKRN